MLLSKFLIHSAVTRGCSGAAVRSLYTLTGNRNPSQQHATKTVVESPDEIAGHGARKQQHDRLPGVTRDDFSRRHIGPNDNDTREMLDTLQLAVSEDQLTSSLFDE